MKERIYVVTGPKGVHLVNSPSRQSAIAFIANNQFKAEVATQMDLVELLEKGYKVEHARVINQELDFTGENNVE